MRKVIILSLLLLFPSSLWARYCNSPNCNMCNRLFGPITYVQPKTVKKTVTTVQETVETEKTSEATIEETSEEGIRTFVQRFRPTRNDIIVDLGCGSGYFLTETARLTGCRGIGIEINKRIAQRALNRVKRADLRRRVRVYVGDATLTRFEPLYWSATYVYAFQFPSVLAQLVPVLPPDAVCISYSHPWVVRRNGKLVGLRQRRIVVGEHVYYQLLRD